MIKYQHDNKTSIKLYKGNIYKLYGHIQKIGLPLKEFEKLLPCKIIGIEQISMGMTNIKFKCIMDGGKKYVVRIPGIGTKSLVNRSNEVHILQRISHLDIDVKTIIFDTKTGIKITQFEENSRILDGSKQRTVKTSAKILKYLHNSEVVFNNKFNFLQLIKQYKKTCGALGIGLDIELPFLLDKLHDQKISILSHGPTLRPCHNDPVPENILLNKRNRPLLIDWEYGGMNDPIWGLAAFSLETLLTSGEERQFLELYYDGDIQNDLPTKMLLYKIGQDFLWYIWSMIKVHYGQDVLEYGESRYKRGKTNLKFLSEPNNF